MTRLEWLLCPYVISVSHYVSDYLDVRRSWKKRLLKPWTFFTFTEKVYAPRAYFIEPTNHIIVSPQTYHRLQTDPNFSLKDLNF